MNLIAAWTIPARKSKVSNCQFDKTCSGIHTEYKRQTVNSNIPSIPFNICFILNLHSDELSSVVGYSQVNKQVYTWLEIKKPMMLDTYCRDSQINNPALEGLFIISRLPFLLISCSQSVSPAPGRWMGRPQHQSNRTVMFFDLRPTAPGPHTAC